MIFIDDVLMVIVNCVIECKIGVCGLWLIMEDILLDIMFDLFSFENVIEVVVNEEVVGLDVKLLIIFVDDEVVVIVG